MIPIFAMVLYSCHHFAMGQKVVDPDNSSIRISWDIIDRYGQESYWLHSDSEFRFTLTVQQANVRGYVEFGGYMRREPDGRRAVEAIRSVHIENVTNYTYSAGPYFVEDVRDASLVFWVNVTVTQPPPLKTTVLKFTFGYMLCTDEEEKCQDAHSTCRLGRSMFCFRNYDTCQTFAPSGKLCLVHEQFSKHQACSERGRNFSSLCHGYVSPITGIRSILMNKDLQCGAQEVFFNNQKTGRYITPGSYVLRSKLLTIGCFRLTDKYLLEYLPVRIVERAFNGTVLFHKNNSACNDLIRLRAPTLTYSVTHLTVSDGNPGNVSSFVKLVNMDVNESHLKVKLCKKALRCDFTAPMPDPGSFRARIVVFKYDRRAEAELRRINYDLLTNYTLNVIVTGYYVCQVKVRFRGCAPFKEFQQTLEKSVHVESLGTCGELQPANIPDTGTGLLAVIIIFVLVLITFIVALSTYCFIRRKIPRRKKTGDAYEQRTTDKKENGKTSKNRVSEKIDQKKDKKRDSKQSTTSLVKQDSKKTVTLVSAKSTTIVVVSKKSKIVESKKQTAHSPKKAKDRKLKPGPKSKEKHRLRSSPPPKKVPKSTASETTTSSGTSKTEKISKVIF